MPKVVTDHALIAELDRAFGRTAPAAAAPARSILEGEERELAKTAPPLAVARDVLSGEILAKLPRQLTGSEAAQHLDLARRTHGLTPEYREVSGSPGGASLQFAANVASDVVGVVGSKASLPVELAVLAGRDMGQLAAAGLQDVAAAAHRLDAPEVGDWLFGEATNRALASRQAREGSALWGAATDSVGRHMEFIKGAMFGASPALYAGADAMIKGDDVGKAAWETLLAYPVTSLLPGVGLGRKAATVGGKPVIRQGETVSTPHGDPVRLNTLGERVFEPVTKLAQSPMVQGAQGAIGDIARSALESAQRTIEPAWQRLAFDVVPPDRVKQQRAIAKANQAANRPSPAAKGLVDAVRHHNLLNDLATEMADPALNGNSTRDKLAALEGLHPEAEGVMDAPLIDPAARAGAQAFGETLVAHGMDPAVAQDVVPFVLFEGIHLNRTDPTFEPMQAISATKAAIDALPPPQRAPYLAALQARAEQSARNPAFVAAADKTWNNNGSLEWAPRSEVRQRDGYLSALESLRKTDRDSGAPVFDLTHPELGELRNTYTFDLFNKHIDELGNTANAKQRVMALLRSAPTSRLVANPNAPAHVQALVQWADRPDGSRRKFLDHINKASVEVAANLGVDPIVVAKHFDRYLSRAFTDAVQVNADLGKMLDAMGQTPALAAKMGTLLRSGRHRRKLTDAEAMDRFGELVDTGAITLDNVLAATAGQMIGMSQHLHSMGEMFGELQAAGRVSDTPRPGWVHTGTAKAALADKAASKDPYNFALGKLADKWVDPVVGKQLGLLGQAVGQAPAWLSLWRWTKTVANVPMYQARNFLQDHAGIWALSGVSPYWGGGKKSRITAEADVQRWHDTGVISPLLMEAMEHGVVDPSGVPMQGNVGNPVAQAYVANIATIINAHASKASDPGARLGAIAEAIAMVRMGKGMPRELATAALTAAQKVRTEYGDRVAKGDPAWRAALPAPSDFMRGMHEALVETGLSRWTANQEQARRLYAYAVGREHLKLAPEHAAVLAAESAYGVERPDANWQKVQNSPVGAIMLPGFFNFGIWQSKKYSQRALNDKGLYAAYVIEQGVRAMNEAELLESDDEAKHWKSRMAAAYMRRSASPDVGLSTGADVADALRTIGLPRAADLLQKGDPAIVFDMRDLGGYQTWLHNIRTDLSGPEYYLQFGPIGGLLAQVADPDSRDPFRVNTGVPQGTPGNMPHFKQYIGGLMAAMSPTWFNRLGEGRSVVHQVVGSVRSVQTGEPQRQYPRGSQLTPIDAIGQTMGPLGISTVDGLAMADAVNRRMKGIKMEITRKAAGEKARIAPSTPAAVAQLQEGQINALAKTKQMELGLSWMYGGMDGSQFRAAREKIEQIRRAEVKRAQTEGSAGSGLSAWWDDATIASGVTAIQEAVTGAMKEFE